MDLAVNLLLNIRRGWWWCYWYNVRFFADVRVVVNCVLSLVRYLDAIFGQVRTHVQVSICLNLSSEFNVYWFTVEFDCLFLCQVDGQEVAFNLHISDCLIINSCLNARCITCKFKCSIQFIGYCEGNRVIRYSCVEGVSEDFVTFAEEFFKLVVNLLLDVRSGWWWCYRYRFGIFMKFWIIVDIVACLVRNFDAISSNVWCQVCIGFNLSLEFNLDCLAKLVQYLLLV